MRTCFYEELIRFRAPNGFLESVANAARAESQTSSEWLRRAALERLKGDSAFKPSQRT